MSGWKELEDFAGRWRLAREIEDFAAGHVVRFSGEALFAPEEGGALALTEEGTLTLPGATPLKASRRYLWRAGQGGAIEVLFADGRPFHVIAPGAKPEAEHLCPPDHYRVAYDFTGWPDWRAVWRVRGPRKDYRMQSLYRRG
ncbi:hypothetical protein SAMN05216257_11021 [Meinhardsimonia xiamenensis]|jgi:hypothetical protein|uniref:DUF6314 domain-containing protein n=1 Tax=Meinhardsimonia xiamenensis TaxID=990712 RepID=A0A1G9H235_9RHOB|nr:DUF6314 family protein [Meinhardsimonia xiamenensis]PRX29760.1 hypothetical protein LV81_02868 [Meinhardsimonia xiamenensis]SDL06987.1 hypothetical protein SAMN05216257_11021 [Meinhardsimonia xiamenensis]